MIINIRQNTSKYKVVPKQLIFAMVAIFLSYCFSLTAYYFIQKYLTTKQTQVIYRTYSVSLSPTIPNNIKQRITTKLENIKYKDIHRFDIENNKYPSTDIVISYKLKNSSDTEPTTGYLLPVGHFYWIKDHIKSEDVMSGDLDIITLPEFETVLRESLPKNNITSLSQEEILEALQNKQNTIALIPLTVLSPSYKLLFLDDKYFLDSPPEGSFQFVLKVQIRDKKNKFMQKVTSDLISNISSDMPFPDPPQIAKVNMTGVTAITRRLTDKIIKTHDGAYPTHKIADFLKEADITHVSNEISFASNCTNSQSLKFCARQESLESLKAIGVDIIELTGNHNNDYGFTNNTNTINTYESLGWKYFGGGLNKKDAATPLEITIDGSKVAFLGYNYYDTIYNHIHALATEDHPGANKFDMSQIASDIKRMKEKGNIVIVDYQFQECYCYPNGYVIYPTCYRPIKNQKEIFRKTIDLGADIVIGTQAHQPQTYELYKGKPIFYGLGNLFFDQTMWPGTRHGLILTHYFINNQHLQTKITTTNYKSDMQTYISNGEEKQQLLQLLKTARTSLN